MEFEILKHWILGHPDRLVHNRLVHNRLVHNRLVHSKRVYSLLFLVAIFLLPPVACRGNLNCRLSLAGFGLAVKVPWQWFPYKTDKTYVFDFRAV